MRGFFVLRRSFDRGMSLPVLMAVVRGEKVTVRGARFSFVVHLSLVSYLP